MLSKVRRHAVVASRHTITDWQMRDAAIFGLMLVMANISSPETCLSFNGPRLCCCSSSMVCMGAPNLWGGACRSSLARTIM